MVSTSLSLPHTHTFMTNSCVFRFFAKVDVKILKEGKGKSIVNVKNLRKLAPPATAKT